MVFVYMYIEWKKPLPLDVCNSFPHKQLSPRNVPPPPSPSSNHPPLPTIDGGGHPPNISPSNPPTRYPNTPPVPPQKQSLYSSNTHSPSPSPNHPLPTYLSSIGVATHPLYFPPPVPRHFVPPAHPSTPNHSILTTRRSVRKHGPRAPETPLQTHTRRHRRRRRRTPAAHAECGRYGG